MREAECGSLEEQEFRRKLEEVNGYFFNFSATIYGCCDNNQTQDCLEEVDRLLKHHNLQIVIIDQKSSDYVFKIEENEKKERGCKYPECHHYDPESKVYCCAGCSSDHYDYDRLHKEEKEARSKLVHSVSATIRKKVRRNKDG